MNRIAVNDVNPNFNPNFDPDNDLYDRESDENFEISRDEEIIPSDDYDGESSNSDEDFVNQRRN